MRKLMMLAAMLAMMLVAAAPAMAQSDDDVIDDDSVTTIQVGDNITTGDINTQLSQNIVGDVSVSATQSNFGDQTAVGDGNVQVIAQSQDVFVGVSQFSFQLLNTGVIVIH